MKRIILSMAFFATMAFVPQSKADFIYDAANDFSTSSNPTGPWSYGMSTSLGSPFVLFGDNLPFDSLNFWDATGIASPSHPFVAHNGTGTTQTFGTGTYAPGQLGFHPGPNGEYGIVQFTTPVAGYYNLVSAFTGLDTQYGTTSDVHVLLNGSSIFDGTVNGLGPGSGPAFNKLLTLSAGDKLEFVVGVGADKSYLNDTTSLSATLTAIPEPSAIVLLGIGLSVAVYKTRGRRRAS